MRLSHVLRSSLKVLREQGPGRVARLGGARAVELTRASIALRGDLHTRRLFLQGLLNDRLEFDELMLTDAEVAACDPALLKAFVLRRMGDGGAVFLPRVGDLDPLALVLLCDALSRHWLYRDLMAIAPTVRARLGRSALAERADTLLRRAAIGAGRLSDAERGLAPIKTGSLAQFLLRGDVWNASGRMDLATAAYLGAIRAQGDNPMARLHYGFHLLKKGQLADGLVSWALAERIFGHFPLSRNEPAWRGEALGGRRLLVVFEHGFGDMIQFARYLVPLLRRYPDAAITGLVPAPIAALMAQSFSKVTFVARRDDASYDFHIASTQLPVVLDAPFHEPRHYLRLAGTGRLPARPPGPFRVGICWRGHPRQYEQSRSIAIAEFARLFAVPDVRFTVLLHSVTAAERAVLSVHANVDVPPMTDFVDLAALVADCDLVVSVDTSVVHLAGAGGKPVLLLSRPDACWRWGAAGRTSPWYDDITVIRHPFDLDWAHVLSEASGLIAEAARRKAGVPAVHTQAVA